MRNRHCRRGAAMVVALFTLMVVMIMAGGLLQSLLAARRQVRRAELALQAEWLAESAVRRARAQLARDGDYAGETWRVEFDPSDADKAFGAAEIKIERGTSRPNARRILVSAHYPLDERNQVTIRREYTMVHSPEP